MATSTHPEEKVYIGATWRFQVKLWNANNTPMDVTNKTLEWAMLDKNGQPVLYGPADAIVNKLNAAQGVIEVVVDKNKTVTLPPGRYTDYLRVAGDNVILEGQLIAKASPFKILIGTSNVSIGAPTFGQPALAVV